jgi:hypothetical protein
MTAIEFKTYLKQRLPLIEYFYVSRNLVSVKNVPIYIIYFNSRQPKSRISSNMVADQNSMNIMVNNNQSLKDLEFSYPILLDVYTREIRENSIIVMVDLAGEALSKVDFT